MTTSCVQELSLTDLPGLVENAKDDEPKDLPEQIRGLLPSGFCKAVFTTCNSDTDACMCMADLVTRYISGKNSAIAAKCYCLSKCRQDAQLHR